MAVRPPTAGRGRVKVDRKLHVRRCLSPLEANGTRQSPSFSAAQRHPFAQVQAGRQQDAGANRHDKGLLCLEKLGGNGAPNPRAVQPRRSQARTRAASRWWRAFHGRRSRDRVHKATAPLGLQHVRRRGAEQPNTGEGAGILLEAADGVPALCHFELPEENLRHRIAFLPVVPRHAPAACESVGGSRSGGLGRRRRAEAGTIPPSAMPTSC